MLPQRLCFSSILTAVMLSGGVASAGDSSGFIDYSPEALLSGENFTQRFNGRFSYDRLNFSCSSSALRKLDSSEGSASLSWLEDWRPWQGSFRLSAGVLYQKQNLGFQCEQESGSLVADARDTRGIDSGLMPYMGLGWNAAWLRRDRLGVNLDLGLLYGTGVDEKIPEGAYRPWRFEPASQDYLKDLEELELRPVFSVGVSYAF